MYCVCITVVQPKDYVTLLCGVNKVYSSCRHVCLRCGYCMVSENPPSSARIGKIYSSFAVLIAARTQILLYIQAFKEEWQGKA